MPTASILLVDDDLEHRTAFGLIFKDWGFELALAKDGLEAVRLASRKRFDMIVMDVKMDGLNGLQALAFIKHNERAEAISGLKGESMNRQTPVLMLTGYGTVGDAVKAMKDGAYDFLIKSEIDYNVLRVKIENALEHFRLREAKEAGLIGEQNLIIGQSQAFARICELVERIAPTLANVLITGESGVGKEVIARLIWSKSQRANQVFATCNCSAMSKDTVEDTLFGHRKGAFTGAVADRQGLIKSAEGGTVFLDEIGETTSQFQTKLLRALQEGEIQPLGSDQCEKVDVRFLAATNVDLEREIEAGNFREDIFHRFTFKIRVPSLRERPEDLPELADYFLKRCALRNGREVTGFSPGALAALERYSWPGNVRELQNAMEYVVVMMTSDQVAESDLPEFVTSTGASRSLGRPPGAPFQPQALKDLERTAVINALEFTSGIKKKAAELLGITRKTLLDKIKLYKLTQFLVVKDSHLAEGEEGDDFEPDEEEAKGEGVGGGVARA
ncbi:MAG: sigma-54 dependent transcriptional regulator [Deltaproteobacteria bacterium]|jgi:two-component system response regulator HydG|nr:sigma-54 dependent transcriptional regulator [Deltaproteobacteria bacterium]